MRLSYATFLAALCLLACGPEKIELRIGDVMADPGRYDGKFVEVEGEVSGAFGILSVGLYRFKDGSGEIPVITTRGLPAIGSRFTVQGTVLDSLVLAGQHYGTAIRETARIYPEPE